MANKRTTWAKAHVLTLVLAKHGFDFGVLLQDRGRSIGRHARRVRALIADGLYADRRRVFNEAEQKRCAEALPEEVVDPAIGAAATERIGGGRSDVDSYASRGYSAVPQHEQPVLAAI